MRSIDIFDKLKELHFDASPEQLDRFRRLAGLLALRWPQDGPFYLSNWLRGPLLYALVQSKRPRYALEFGAGRGYGAVCMAQASIDAGFECTVLTIDRIPETRKQAWIMDDGTGPMVKYVSLREVWSRYCTPEATARIRVLQGDSSKVMSRWRRLRLPKVDFVFLDGGHDYWTVKHDFMAALKVANSEAAFLFDDYGERPGYGVKRLFDREVAPRCPAEDTDVLDTHAEAERAGPGPQVDHRMALANGGSLSQFEAQPFPRLRRQAYLAGYRVGHRLRRWAWSARAMVPRLSPVGYRSP